MKIKKSNAEIVFDTLNVVMLSALVIVTFYPFLYVVLSSVSEASKLVAYNGLLIKPVGFSLEAYRMVFKNPMIVRGYLNTILIVVVGTSLNIFMTSLGAYVLSRKKFMLKSPMMVMIVVTMFFSGGLVPYYLNIKSLGLYNSILALIIPGAMSTWNLIIMRTSFMALPASLEESVKIDGGNDFTILFKIVLPLSKAVISVMVLYYGVAHWNSWFSAMLFIRDREWLPLQIILREVLLQDNQNEMLTGVGDMEKADIAQTIKYATIIISTLPIMLVYPFLQKYFVKGVMIGALKG